MTARCLLHLLAAWLISTGAIAHAQISEAALPPLKYPQISALLDALRIDDEIVRNTDPFWQPAITAFVAANPEKVEAARVFATTARNREREAYRPLIAFLLNRNLPVGIYPDLSTQMRALSDCRGQSCVDDQTKRAAKYRQLQAEGAQRFEADLSGFIRQATSADAVALRQLNRAGLWNCHVSRGHWLSKEAEDRHVTRCAPLLSHPVLQKLKRTAAGNRLIMLETTAYTELAGMVAMAHDAGISLHLLLPPEAVTKAGLTMPPQNLSYEELVSSYSNRTSGGER